MTEETRNDDGDEQESGEEQGNHDLYVHRKLVSVYAPLGPESFREALVDILYRVPRFDLLHAFPAFFLVDANFSDFLSKSYLENRTVVFVGAAGMAQPEEERMRTILTLAAHCIMGSKKAFESAGATDGPLDRKNSRHTAEEVYQQIELDAHAKAKHLMQVHFQDGPVAERVQEWLDAREAEKAGTPAEPEDV